MHFIDKQMYSLITVILLSWGISCPTAKGFTPSVEGMRRMLLKGGHPVTASTELFMDKAGGRKSSAKKRAGATSKGFAGALKNLQVESFKYAGSIKPGKQSPQKIVVDENIMLPDYAKDGLVSLLERDMIERAS